MVAKVLKLTLLNHLFYYTEVSGGSTSASVTGDFIGDLALNYAFKKALQSNDNHYRYLKRPKYEEIKDFGFYCTVARPVNRSKRTEAYIQNTLFNVDGYIDVKAIEKSGKSPFKNFRQVQGIEIGTTYQALFFAKEDFKLPPVVRVGRALETLVLVEEVALDKKMDDEFWLNAFSLKTVFDNLDTTVQILIKEQKVNFSNVLESYNIIKQITFENAQTIFKNTFDNG
ncbi:MAG: type I-D CRISPR-associated protein Cas5/Csc1 [Saprospiraceae bacterium]